LRPRFRNPESPKKRSQDLPTLYLPTGAVWVSTGEALREQKTFYSKDWDAFEVDWIDGIDIDDEVTLTLAKALFPYRAGSRDRADRFQTIL
jgi:N-acylneuraminate cytidylyltransferase